MTDTLVPTTSERRAPWATAPLSFALGVAALLMLVLGLVTPWVDVSVDRAQGSAELQAAIDAEIHSEYGSTHPIGISLADGPTVIVLAFAVVGLLALHHRRARRGRGLPIGAFVAATLLAVVGIGNLADIADKADKVRQSLPVSLDPSIGLYLVLLGGLLAMACAGCAIATAAPKQPTDSVA